MTSAPELAGAVARRFLVLRHMLAPPRSLPPGEASVRAVFDRLGSVQFDPLEVAGRNHDVVLLARVSGYRRDMTDALLYRDRVLYETYNKGLSLVPTSELPWYRLTWDRNRAEHEGGAFDEHAPLVEELLERIRTAGPMSSTDVEPRGAIDWYWRPTNQVRAILEALAEAGILGLARREGNRRVYDLVERLFPADLLAQRPPEGEQRQHRLLSRYRAHGLLGTGGQAELWVGTARTAAERAILRDALVAAGSLVPVAVEGVRGQRFVLADELPILRQAEAEVEAEGRRAAGARGAPGPVAGGDARPALPLPGGHAAGAAFLAPLDPLVWDRELLRSLFGFDYLWEVYVPAARRRWGYYVLPILYGDRFVGRIEPRIDRAAGALRVLGLWWERDVDPLERGLPEAVAEALAAHLRFAGLRRVMLPRTRLHAPFVARVREALAATLDRGGVREAGERRGARSPAA